MLTVKTFKDGDRLVVVFEGLHDIPSEETLIQSFLSGITGAQVNREEAIDAKPVKQDTEIPTIEEADPVFADGEYEGMTPEEVIKTGRAKGFTFLAEHMDDETLPENLKSRIKESVRAYLSNFKGCDPLAYSNKLSFKQVCTFLTQYLPVLPDGVRDEAFENGQLLDPQYEVNLRDCVNRAIRHFQKM